MTASMPAPGTEPLAEHQRQLMFAMVKGSKQWRRRLVLLQTLLATMDGMEAEPPGS
jgi:hypothetical protein